MKPNVEVALSSPQWRALPDVEDLARRAVEASLEESGARILDGAEVSVLLADDAEARALNKRWRGVDAPTNVLSFPAAAPAKLATTPMLGDIVVAFETTQREAAAEGKAFADHFTHLVAHGFLHLVGFDHQTPTEAERMEALERAALRRLGVADPYAQTIPADGEA